MPNWAEGNIRFRGKRENLMNFFRHELVSLTRKSDGSISERPIKLDDTSQNGYQVKMIRDQDTENSLYFRGSNRQFVDMDLNALDCMIEFSEGRNLVVDQTVVMTGYKGAWNVDVSYFQEKAQRYKIDIRIFVWERGLEWSNVTTWYRNGKMEDESRTYSDWLWDAAMPWYGG